MTMDNDPEPDKKAKVRPTRSKKRKRENSPDEVPKNATEKKANTREKLQRFRARQKAEEEAAKVNRASEEVEKLAAEKKAKAKHKVKTSHTRKTHPPQSHVKANGTTTAKAKLLRKAESDDESIQSLEEGPAPGSQPNS